jgi:ribosomal protein S28E/S33
MNLNEFYFSLHECSIVACTELVQVGVISLGTTSQDGNMRQVKVEVLGVMDPENKLIRLRAVEPIQVCKTLHLVWM